MSTAQLVQSQKVELKDVKYRIVVTKESDEKKYPIDSVTLCADGTIVVKTIMTSEPMTFPFSRCVSLSDFVHIKEHDLRKSYAEGGIEELKDVIEKLMERLHTDVEILENIYSKLRSEAPVEVVITEDEDC